jgi:hypothetical protein
VVDLVADKLMVALVGWWDGGEREVAETRKRLVFWPNFDPTFFMLRPWNPHLFIGGGIGFSCLHRGELSALDSAGKNLNRWFKVVILNYQIWQFKPVWGGHFRPALELLCCHLAWTGLPENRGLLGDHFDSRVVTFKDIQGIKCT